jgi:diadenosine tetraphosphatase ApaH/serine/threonine PP2A family protein phosphatase
MRYAILGDIHGNTEALTAVFGDIEEAGVDRCLCLGDIVGYGAEPEQCIREIRSRRIETVMGNHDSAAVGDTPLDYFNPYARAAVEWTAGTLSAAARKYLSELPLSRDYDGFTVVHSTLANPKEWGYIIDLESAMQCFDLLKTQVCFIGHSHMPVVFKLADTISWHRENAVPIKQGARYIVNVGSVGQPRDGDPRSSYGIYDTGKKIVEIRRVAYDVGSTQNKIVSAGLPEFLARRLEFGR